MASAPEYRMLSFAEIVDALDDLVRRGRTGTVNVLTDSKTYVRIGLKKGRFIHFIFGKHKGEDALAYFKRIRSGKYAFWEGAASDSPPHLLPTPHELIHELRDATAGTLLRTSPNDSDPTRSFVPPPDAADAEMGGESNVFPPATTGSQDLGTLSLRGDALYEAVLEELALYLGPMAAMALVDYGSTLKAVANTDQLRDVLVEIGEGLGNAQQAEAFTRTIVERV